jgi:DNA-binding NtrC family response regulator
MAQREREVRGALVHRPNTRAHQVRNYQLKIMSDAHDTLLRILSTLERPGNQGTQLPDISGGIDFYEEVERFEISLIQMALDLAEGSQRRAASILGMASTTLNNKIKVYKIKWKVFKSL